MCLFIIITTNSSVTSSKVRFSFVLIGQEVTVRAGEVLCIPPNVPHEAHALEDTVDLDIFNPPRQDWLDRDDAYLRQATTPAV